MSNTRKPRTEAAPAPDLADLPPVPGPETLTFDEMWRIKAATGIDVLDPPIRGLAIAACLWFATRDLPTPLTWEQATAYRLEDIEIVGDLDESLDRDDTTGEPTPDAAADPTDGSGTPSSE